MLCWRHWRRDATTGRPCLLRGQSMVNFMSLPSSPKAGDVVGLRFLLHGPGGQEWTSNVRLQQNSRAIQECKPAKADWILLQCQSCHRPCHATSLQLGRRKVELAIPRPASAVARCAWRRSSDWPRAAARPRPATMRWGAPANPSERRGSAALHRLGFEIWSRSGRQDRSRREGQRGGFGVGFVARSMPE